MTLSLVKERFIELGGQLFILTDEADYFEFSGLWVPAKYGYQIEAMDHVAILGRELSSLEVAYHELENWRDDIIGDETRGA